MMAANDGLVGLFIYFHSSISIPNALFYLLVLNMNSKKGSYTEKTQTIVGPRDVIVKTALRRF